MNESESPNLASFFRSVRDGDLDLMRHLLQTEATLLTQREDSRDGWAAIYHAAAAGQVAAIALLLDAECSPDLPSGINDGDGNFELGTRPLTLAAWKNHPSIANILLSRGANPDGADYFDHGALHAAVAHNHGPVLNLLLAHGAAPNIFSNRRHFEEELDWHFYGSPLHVAANNNAVEAARILLAHGAKLDSSWIDQCTPLFYAAARGSFDVARLLLQSGADPNAREDRKCYTFKFDYTPLHYAARNGHAETVKVLLENGADKTLRETAGNLTAMELGVQEGHEGVVCLLQ